MGRIDECTSPLPGEWMKGKLVGSGSFGSVHLAMSKSTGGLFVVKSSQSCDGALALENEAMILESLNSPYVVRCMGIENGRGKSCNVFLEYMAGGSLSDVAQIFAGAFDEDVVRLYSREILHGLKYLHKKGIVHCDLKCKNVLLSSSGNVKLADFGCAKRLKDEGNPVLSTAIGGTPLWMAPEVLRNEGLDFACDIWSLGCTVIEMATGRAPWAAEISDPVAAVLKIACSSERPQFPRHFSSEGLDFLAKCLERDPKRRWSAEQLLNHPFVSGNPMRVSRKGETFSPASTLDDIATYDDTSECNSDCGDESCEGNEFAVRNPFSRCSDERSRNTVKPVCHFESSEFWITVR
ncbi:mitogen-activated protein kinase kinase kinase 17-like [Argentina anserina]|uniref:mitogen-activated protein kinase kinase kinase 17-like n=1 Tax=Argentina anserina TaxID=57926 RepID=UPI0021763058|nr:mitogen-activated protein kinase kinase kinase 17-like [Potentilla anserina]